MIKLNVLYAGGGSSESEGECGGGGAACAGGRARAQYVSANCVVFTHYSGDVAAVVDDHFARALAQDKHKGMLAASSQHSMKERKTKSLN